MDRAPVTRVVIAGGGTAGWIAAAALAQRLRSLVEITLVESDAIGTVGVGESTIPTARSFHTFLGIDEAAFMRATQATFKLGISFENWHRPGDRYFHSFGSVGRSTMLADFQHFWLEARRQGFGRAFSDYSLEARAAALNRFATAPDSELAYAYHLDATAYGRFLRVLAEAAGARRVEGMITGVEQDSATGAIDALVLASGERVEGDLFIDCTGFRALLIGQTMKVDFEDWSPWLTTDSAVVVQTEAHGELVPYTRAIAHEAGWRWRIPLQTRVGNGFVFSSAHMTDDDARAALTGDIDGAPVAEPRLIRYRSGYRPPWKANCVALGLAGGFLEPLESTSIHLIMIAVTRLIQLFPFGGATPALAARFNAQSRHEWENIRDFLILHYSRTAREEPFWQQCREAAVPDSLAARIALFHEAGIAWQGADDLFRIDSWVQVMMGQGLAPERYHHLPQLSSPDQLRTALADLDGTIERTVAAMPSHADFVRQHCGGTA
ncbi:MAG TPA: tryptophan halogenase family protein [Sphingomonas sp.]|nr:tryptophan halogenase family protein [Sphingomonas sp.]